MPKSSLLYLTAAAFIGGILLAKLHILGLAAACFLAVLFWSAAALARRHTALFLCAFLFCVLALSSANAILKQNQPFIQEAESPLRQQLLQKIDQLLEEPAGTLVKAMLFGERRISPEIKELFKKTGTIHLLVASGLNVGFVWGLLFLVLKVLRLPRRVATATAMAALLCYMILAGAEVPIVRATIMAEVYLAGRLLNRQAPITHLLAIAALIILFLYPKQLFSVGFQLSFLSVLSIALLVPYFEKTWRLGSLPLLPRTTLNLAGVSLAAWLGVWPVILYHFHIITPVALLANLVLVPLAFLVTAAGIAMLVFSIGPGPLAICAAGGTWLITVIFFGLNSFFARLPYGCITIGNKIPLYIIFLYYTLLGALLRRRDS